jgi:hypothetical protein
VETEFFEEKGRNLMSAANGKTVERNRIAGKLRVPLSTVAGGRPKNGHHRQSSRRNGASRIAPTPLLTTSDGRPKNGHDAQGRFTKGNKASRGNAFSRRTAALRAIALDAVTEEDVRAVMRKLIEQAKTGDAAAAKLLLAYVIGRPTEAVNPDRVDLEEFRMLEECPTPAKVIRLLLDSLPPATVVDLVREHLPDTAKRVAKKIFQGDLTEQVLREQRARTGK